MGRDAEMGWRGGGGDVRCGSGARGWGAGEVGVSLPLGDSSRVLEGCLLVLVCYERHEGHGVAAVIWID